MFAFVAGAEMNPNLKSNKHSVGQSAYHMVWRPKYNVSVFRKEFPRHVIDSAIREVAEKHGIKLIELKIVEDHIHCFAEIPPTMSLSKAFQYLKGGSARIFFKKCTVWYRFFTMDGSKKAHLWSPGKFYRSVGSVRSDVIRSYIKYSQGGWDFDFVEEK